MKRRRQKPHNDTSYLVTTKRETQGQTKVRQNDMQQQDQNVKKYHFE